MGRGGPAAAAPVRARPPLSGPRSGLSRLGRAGPARREIAKCKSLRSVLRCRPTRREVAKAISLRAGLRSANRWRFSAGLEFCTGLSPVQTSRPAPGRHRLPKQLEAA
eukprot:10510755-Alexandrium_andersonii.AAC.1